MKLSISKTDTIELVEVQQDADGRSRYGREFNVLGREDSGRLSEIINRAVRSHFGMPDADRLFEGGREAKKAADKIKPAIFVESNTQLLRMVYKELAIRFDKNVRTKTRKKDS